MNRYATARARSTSKEYVRYEIPNRATLAVAKVTMESGESFAGYVGAYNL